MTRSRFSLDRRQILISTLAALGEMGTPGHASADVTHADRVSLDQMIGQMIVMGFEGAETTSRGAVAIGDWLRQGLIGGVIFFDVNIESPQEAARFTRFFLDAAAPIVPFLCIDQEGGAVVRLRPEHGFAPLPSARDIAATSVQNAEAVYERSASELHHLGFNVNFGPVVDLAVNTDNHIIEALGRSYGADPETVIKYAKAFINAHRRNHVLTALKHFPGHGSTSVDSHVELPDITEIWRRDELRPFAELARGGYADMVMVGHLVHAELTGSGRPATLSALAVQGLLRDKLGYAGVAISDDMQMGALRRFFPPDECILLGIEAGLDLFLYTNRDYPDPEMPGRFHRVVKAALESGRLKPGRIETSYSRLKRLKGSIESNISRMAPK
jgi:beta-N-acetylhexosaminidase